MAADKGKRLATAVGFLTGLLACLDAVRDAKVLWPPAVLWSTLTHPHRLELGCGMALMVVSLALSLWRPAE